MAKFGSFVLAILLLLVAVIGVPNVVAASPVHVSVLGTPISLGTPFQISFYIDVSYCTHCGTATAYVRAASSYTHLWESSSMTVGGGLDYEVNVPGISTPGSYVAGVTVIGPSSGGLPGAAVLGETTFSVSGSGSASTDWAVLSVALTPPNPQVGDQVLFSMTMTAVSTSGSFPQNVHAKCTIDGVLCGGGTVTYPGPTGIPATVSAESPWTATPGPHTLRWTISTLGDPDPSNNEMSASFTVTSVAPASFDFSISVSPSQQTVSPGSSTTYSVTVSSLSGPPQSVDLTISGTPAGASGSLNPSSGTPPFTSTLTITTTSSASPGTFPITINGVGGGVNHNSQVTLTISQAPDFRIDVNPPSQNVPAGATASYSVNVVALNGFNSQVSLTVSGLPSGGNGVFSIPSATPTFTSTLTITLPVSTAAGSFTLTVTGTGGGISRVANLVLTITQTQATETTQSTLNTANPPGLSDLMNVLQQNSLGILLAVVIVVLLVAVVASRRGRSTRVQQPTSQPGTKYCTNCGAPNPVSNEFCGRCGTKM